MWLSTYERIPCHCLLDYQHHEVSKFIATLLLQGGILDLSIHTNHYVALGCIYRWRPWRPGRLCLPEHGLLCAGTGL